MEDLRDDKPSTIVDIFTKGDVILVVGSEKVKLRVNSMFLKTASRPFLAMFEPVWNKGNMLGRDESTEIPLPEDDASALQIICAIIHHQSKLLPQTLTASDVLGIAITADKYDCLDALKFASTNWLQPHNRDVNSLIRLTAAAYIFQDAAAFKRITKALILNHGGTYLALSCEEVVSVMPWRVFCRYLSDQSGHVRNMTDWPMLRSARRTKKLHKAEASGNTYRWNK